MRMRRGSGQSPETRSRAGGRKDSQIPTIGRWKSEIFEEPKVMKKPFILTNHAHGIRNKNIQNDAFFFHAGKGL